MEKIKTFTELFEKLEMGGIYADFAYILDAPDHTFNAIKEDFKDSLIQSFDLEQLTKDINSIKGLNYQIEDFKQGIIDGYDAFKNVFEEIDHELPQERVDFFLGILKALRDNVLSLPKRRIVQVIIEKEKDAITPQYAHDTDAGADVFSNETVEIPAFSTVIVKTGIKVGIPNGWEIQIRPRSGMSAKTPIRIANAPGTIDAGYRGEVGIICHNTSNKTFKINKGDRIAQMVIMPVPMIKFEEGKVSDLSGNRGGGFGSTGTNLKIHNGKI